MARDSMNFNAAIRLNTKDFQKGVNTIKKSINDLKNSLLSLAGALGAGLGFGKLISSIKETAVAFNAAEISLKNVSETSAEFTENQQFLRNIAQKYGQDLLVLIQGFSKFRAAAAQTNLTIQQQRDIYESLTRAAGAYQMSSDQTKNAMMAVEQMLSKGRVAAEELRRQLGNALPGAFVLMSRAAGLAGITVNGTTAELEKAMKAGKVSSEEILPHFAKVLKEATENANFDSLQASLNRLKTTWVDFTKSSGFENFYKTVINRTNDLLKFITNNFKSLFLGGIAGIAGGNFWNKSLKEGTQYYDTLVKKANKLNEEVDRYYKTLLKAQEKNVATTRTNGVYVDKSGAGFRGPRNATFTKTDAQNVIKYNRALAELERIEKELGVSNVKVNQTLLQQSESMAKGFGKVEKYTIALTRQQKIVKGLQLGWANLMNTMKGMLTSMAAGAIIGVVVAGLTKIIEYFAKIIKEAKELKSIVPDMQIKVLAAGSSDDVIKLQKLKNLLVDLDGQGDKIAEKQKVIDNINTLLGRTGKNLLTIKDDVQTKIIPAIDEYIKKLQHAAKQQAILAQVNEKTAEIVRLQTENMEKKLDPNYNKKTTYSNGFNMMAPGAWNQLSTKEDLTPAAKEIDKAIKTNEKKIAEYQKGIDILLKMADDETIKAFFEPNDGPTTPDPDDGKVKGLQKVYQDYIKDLKELNNQLKEGGIFKAEYEESLDKLIIDAWKKASATGELDLGKLTDKLNKGKTLTEFEQWYLTLAQSAREAVYRALAKPDDLYGFLNEVEKQIWDDLDKSIEKYNKAGATDIKVSMKAAPKFKGREDTILDYSKDASDILSEEAKAQREWASTLESTINDVKSEYEDIALASADVQKKLKEMTDEMDRATASAESLEAAMRYQKIKEDINDLNKTIRSTFASGLKGLAQDMDRVVKGAESLRDAFEDDDTTAWEKFMAVFNEIVQMVDLVVGTMSSLKTIKEASAKLAGAEIAQNAALLELQQKRVDLERMLYIWKQKNMGLSSAAIAQEAAEAAASRATSTAKAGEAVAGATASGAKLPFPWNLAAIALGVATVLAALSAGTMKFAKGGIVGGSSYSGDNVLARVNSGEAVLNRQQQSTLFDILNGKKGVGGGGQVEFKIKGDTLVGVLNNHSRIRKG